MLAARKEVDFSSVWFLVVVLVGMAVDIAVWEPLRALPGVAYAFGSFLCAPWWGWGWGWGGSEEKKQSP